MTIELTQREANLLLRGLEDLQATQPSESDEAAAKKLWSKIFDTGLKAGFGIPKDFEKETNNDA